jgi:hypothetical protein
VNDASNVRFYLEDQPCHDPADDALDSTTAGRPHIDDSVAVPQLVAISEKADPIASSARYQWRA